MGICGTLWHGLNREREGWGGHFLPLLVNGGASSTLAAAELILIEV